MTDTDPLVAEQIDDLRVVTTPRPDVIYLPDTEPLRRPEETEGTGRDFGKLWGAAGISSIGDGVRITALPLLAAAVTHNPVLVSGILLASKLPWLLFSLLAGAIADRVDRRTLVVRVNLVRAVVMAALCVAVLGGHGSLALLYVVALFQGIGEVFSDNTAFAMLPSIVGKDDLERANGRLEAVVLTTNMFAGPALGGFLFAMATGLPFAVDAASFAAAGILFALIGARKTQRPIERAEATTIRQDIAEGLKWLQSRPVLRNLSYIAALTNFFLNATFAIFVLYALEVLKLHPAGFGVLLSIEAVGVLAGSLLAARIRTRLGMGPTILVALSIAGLGNLVIGTTSNVVLVAAMMISIAFCGGLWNVITNSFRQAMVPDHLLGRVQSAHRLLSWGAIPLGSLFGGIVADTLGIKAPFLIASAALCLLAVAAFAMFAAPVPAAALSE